MLYEGIEFDDTQQNDLTQMDYTTVVNYSNLYYKYFKFDNPYGRKDYRACYYYPVSDLKSIILAVYKKEDFLGNGCYIATISFGKDTKYNATDYDFSNEELNKFLYMETAAEACHLFYMSYTYGVENRYKGMETT